MATITKPGSLSGSKWFRRTTPADNEVQQHTIGTSEEIALSADGNYTVVTTIQDDWKTVPDTHTTMPL